ncbi:hypothetical protein PVAND_016011 [Polypedilum vanderplanki]|uniref:C2H2-type domain-containing protein n=1 Tax=Polypedilum vanderplanki TaxID=319348 RepID=A0A9J6BEL3_POLVA|nr:hypothetical protein PVAND_016011 [Polypedilum vanderplanki]
MSLRNTQICRCCLRVLKNTESRLQTNKKNSEIFKNFIGISLLPGIICGKCNLNLLTFDAFQQEIKRKHEEIVKNVVIKQEKDEPAKSELFAVPIGEEMIEAVLMDEGEELVDGTEMVEAVLAEEPDENSQKAEENSNDENQASNSEEDEDVILLPQEPQVPIDLDEISDEPQQSKPKAPEEIIFKCDHCTAVSAKKEVIVRHIKQSHTFKCETCSKVYPSEERLKGHIMRTHAVVGNRRKQSMVEKRSTDENLRFRMKSKPYGRPWPSRFAKGEYGDQTWTPK